MTPNVPSSKPTTWYLVWLKRFERIARIPAKFCQLVLAKGTRWSYRRAGIQFLTSEETASFLAPYRLVTYPVNTLSLTEVVDLAEPAKIYFEPVQAETEPVSVWHYDTTATGAKLSAYGGIITQQRALCLDINTDDFYRSVLHRTKRQTRHADTLLAPWSHYLDGSTWGGYYDFVILVAGKLCRMKDALPESVYNEALVAYPLFNTSYEREYLALLGIQADRLFDSRMTDITFNQCVLANAGHWFYPNRADIDALRRYVLTRMPAVAGQRNRIYVSRSNRRRVQNEGDVIDLLKQYGFQVIDDRPRPVAEQIAIYQQAEYIIGPHGASFTNILWCQPGTHLFELFSPTYVPDFFRYLAGLLGLHYHAYFHGVAGTDDWAKGLEDDMFISITQLKQCLEKIFLTKVN